MALVLTVIVLTLFFIGSTWLELMTLQSHVVQQSIDTLYDIYIQEGYVHHLFQKCEHSPLPKRFFLEQCYMVKLPVVQ